MESSSGYIYSMLFGEGFSDTKPWKKIENSGYIEKFMRLAKKKLCVLQEALDSPELCNKDLTSRVLNLFHIHYNLSVRIGRNTTTAMALGISTTSVDLAEILTQNT